MSDSVQAVRQIILGDQSLVDSLTTGGVIKVRQGHAGQTDRLPYVLLWSITDRPVHYLGGRTGTREGVVQVDVYANDLAEAGEIAAQIGDVIDDFGRGWTTENDDTVWVMSILEEASRANDQMTRDGAEKAIAGVQTDYRLVYKSTS